MKDCVDIKIYYEDTDCGGVVYYGKYLAYLERARTEYLENRGISLRELMGEGIFFVVVHVDIHYHMPSKYGDTLSVCSEVSDVTTATITFQHDLFLKETDSKIVTATVKLACIGSTMKPQRMKSTIVNALKTG